MKIKKIFLSALAVSSVAVFAAGCGKQEEPAETVAETTTAETTEAVAQAPAGKYFSEITGEPINDNLKNQRPVAVMIDNESIAYPHYGIAESDVVYEMMNSTLNGRITRLMCIVKDWEKIEKMGSIRSSRPTNIILQSEWNSVFCHDGGPSYVKQYFAKDYASDHFSGDFSRVENGKAWEFTEYILSGDLDSRFSSSGYSKTYTDKSKSASHFNFVTYGKEVDIKSTTGAKAVKSASLPFEHTESKLVYDSKTSTYDYYSYGSVHKDEEDGEKLTFENVIIQDCSFKQYDDAGYMIYNVVQKDPQPGYYISNGYMQKITWTKDSEDSVTKYYDADGKELTINRGKTYIGIVPSDSWSKIVFK